MEKIEIVLSIFGSISFLANILAAAAYSGVLRKARIADASKEVIAMKDEQIKTFRDGMAILEKKFSDMEKIHKEDVKLFTEKIGNLTGALNARDKQVKELQDLLLQRSPEMENFFKKAGIMVDQAESHYKVVEDYCESSEELLKEVHDLCHNINEKLLSVVTK